MSEQAILQNKINAAIDNGRARNANVLDKIQSDGFKLNDAIVSLGSKTPVSFYANGKMKMNIEDMSFKIHPHALTQLATKLGIPTRYVKDLTNTQWGRDLLQKMLTEHTHNTSRSKLLIREIDDEVRGVLSDKYRRLNTAEIYNQFIERTHQSDAVIYEADYLHTKTYMSAMIPKVFEIPTENNGTVFSVFGAKISNSDYGDGALSLRAFQMNVVCMNGMTSDTILNQVHLGKRIHENIQFSERTYKLDTQAMASAVDDIMNSVFSEDRIKQTVSHIRKASETLIDIDKELVWLNKSGVGKEDCESIKNKLVENNYEDGLQGKATKWKLSQALTSYGNKVKADGENRKYHDFEELAGKLIKLS